MNKLLVLLDHPPHIARMTVESSRHRLRNRDMQTSVIISHHVTEPFLHISIDIYTYMYVYAHVYTYTHMLAHPNSLLSNHSCGPWVTLGDWPLPEPTSSTCPRSTPRRPLWWASSPWRPSSTGRGTPALLMEPGRRWGSPGIKWNINMRGFIYTYIHIHIYIYVYICIHIIHIYRYRYINAYARMHLCT